jgi:hypothetical protein
MLDFDQEIMEIGLFCSNLIEKSHLQQSWAEPWPESWPEGHRIDSCDIWHVTLVWIRYQNIFKFKQILVKPSSFVKAAQGLKNCCVILYP